MKAMSQPTAFGFMQDYFRPLTFQAAMDSPTSIEVTLSYAPTGETISLPGIPCAISLTCEDMFVLIQEIESGLIKLKPSFLAKLDLSRYSK